MWSFLKCHTLDVWDWICGNTYPRQEKLDLLRDCKVDSTAFTTVDSAVNVKANVTANTKANITASAKVKLTDPIAAMEADWNAYLKERPDKVDAELTAAGSNPGLKEKGLKKRPDKVIVELTAANDPRSPRPETRIVQIIRQPTLLCWSGAPASFEQDVWTETHPQGSMCATSYVPSHQEF